MAARSDNILLCGALVLSAVAAVATMPADPAETLRKLQWLLVEGTTPEVIMAVGAIGGPMTGPISP